MLTSALYASCRYRLPDESFSTYQIVDALNYVMREINVALNGVTSSLTTKTATLTITAGAASLPTDFESMISVGGPEFPTVNLPYDRELDTYSYQIVGDTIEIEGTTVDIYYRKSFAEYTWDGAVIAPATIDLPASFNNMVVDSVANRTMGQPVSVQQQALRLIASRDGKKRDRTLIFTM